MRSTAAGAERLRRGRGVANVQDWRGDAIPIRTFTPWEDERPGFLEIDLVAHCGSSTEGIYLNTLTGTDLATGWTECLALANKTQAAVSQAIGLLCQPTGHTDYP